MKIEEWEPAVIDFIQGYKFAMRNVYSVINIYSVITDETPAYKLGIQHALKAKKKLELEALLEKRDPDINAYLSAASIPYILIKAGLLDPNWRA